MGIDPYEIRKMFCDEEFPDKLISYGKLFQEQKNTTNISLFGNSTQGIEKPVPKETNTSSLELLHKEKALVGIYLSGHPLQLFVKSAHRFVTESNGKFFVKTSSNGNVNVFESIDEFLLTKYNKGICFLYCSDVHREGKRMVCSLEGYRSNATFKSMEFGSKGNVYMNKIDELKPLRAYMLFLERNTHTENGCQILNAVELTQD